MLAHCWTQALTHLSTCSQHSDVVIIFIQVSCSLPTWVLLPASISAKWWTLNSESSFQFLWHPSGVVKSRLVIKFAFQLFQSSGETSYGGANDIPSRWFLSVTHQVASQQVSHNIWCKLTWNPTNKFSKNHDTQLVYVESSSKDQKCLSPFSDFTRFRLAACMHGQFNYFLIQVHEQSKYRGD